MTQQIFEQVELAGGELDRPIAADDAARDEVDLQVARLQPKHVRRPAAAEHRADAREQLGQRERLDQIIVGAQVQPAHPIVDAVARGQDQHRRLDLALPQRLQDLEPAAARQHQVEHDQVERFCVGAEKPSSPVAATTTS